MTTDAIADFRESFEVRDLLRIIWNRKFLILAVGIAVAAAALYWSSSRVPMYQAQASVLVTVPPDVTAANTSANLKNLPNMANEIEVASSTPVIQQVERKLGITIPAQRFAKHLRVTNPPNTTILDVAYQDHDPKTAAEVAQTFANVYVDERSAATLQQVSQAEGQLNKSISSIQSQVSDLEKQMVTTTDTGLRQALNSRVNVLLANLGVMQQHLLDISLASTGTQGGQIVTQATVPTNPTGPKKTFVVVIGLLAGLLLGTVLALTIELLSDKVKSRAEVERRLGAPILSMIPRIKGWRRKADVLLVADAESQDPSAEAYRTLATSVRYAASKLRLKCLVVTSCMPGEGKTSTVANLGVSLARSGRRTIVVSGDLRRPRLHKFFGMSRRGGLTEVLGGSLRLQDALRDTDVVGLKLLDAGADTPADPASLLASHGLADVLGALAHAADFVIIDAPPALPVADASILAAAADATVVVVDPKEAGRSALSEIRRQLSAAGVEILGVVYNNFGPRDTNGYRYSYYRYHARSDDQAASVGGKVDSRNGAARVGSVADGSSSDRPA